MKSLLITSVLKSIMNSFLTLNNSEITPRNSIELLYLLQADKQNSFDEVSCIFFICVLIKSFPI